MKKAIDYGFDIFITIDKNMAFQQNIHRFNIALVVFDVINSKIENLIMILLVFNNNLNTYQKGKVYLLNAI